MDIEWTSIADINYVGICGIKKLAFFNFPSSDLALQNFTLNPCRNATNLTTTS